jgi:hypothetical protein
MKMNMFRPQHVSRQMMGMKTHCKLKVKRTQGYILWGLIPCNPLKTKGVSEKEELAAYDLKVCDDVTLVQILRFWTLSIVLSLSKTS